MQTRQEIVDMAVRGLRAQGFQKSVERATPSSRCKYRGPGGLKCAIGHCIPDDKYKPSFEDLSIFDQVLAACNISLDDWGFARGLQSCHDKSTGPIDMVDRLKKFCAAHALSFPEEVGH